ncbi:hypothetical protein Holit_00345 [Hollandina sp. SP2]
MLGMEKIHIASQCLRQPFVPGKRCGLAVRPLIHRHRLQVFSETPELPPYSASLFPSVFSWVYQQMSLYTPSFPPLPLYLPPNPPPVSSYQRSLSGYLSVFGRESVHPGHSLLPKPFLRCKGADNRDTKKYDEIMQIAIAINCPNISRNRKKNNGKQNYRCKDCGRHFISDQERTYGGMFAWGKSMIRIRLVRGVGIWDMGTSMTKWQQMMGIASFPHLRRQAGDRESVHGEERREPLPVTASEQAVILKDLLCFQKVVCPMESI